MFLHTLLNWNDEKISVLVYREPTHTDQYLHYSSHQGEHILLEHIPLSRIKMTQTNNKASAKGEWISGRCC